MSNFALPQGMVSETSFFIDSAKYKEKYYVYVEGKTDKTFYCKILNNDSVLCRSVSEATQSDLCFKDPKSNKKSIVNSLLLKKSPPIFGIVDRDNDTKSSGNGLFYTDTRDLETLLVLSDDKLCEKLGCQVDSQDVKQALFMAYQWGYLKQAFELHKNPNEIRKKIILGAESYFNDEHQINVPSIREHLKKIGSEHPSNQELKKFINADKNINGTHWKGTIALFEANMDSEVWKYINGHDFLYFLKVINIDICNKYGQMTYGLEYALINNYNIGCFKKTILYSSLFEAGLISI